MNILLAKEDSKKSRWQLYLFGLVIVFAISVIEASKGRALNFYIYQYAAFDYWNGLDPFVGFCERHNTDVFIYLPPFFYPFAVFSFLPSWCGSVAWNLFNFNLLFISILMLPGLSWTNKRFVYLYTIAIFAQAFFSFQYNVTLAYIFLFAFALLERKQYWWALLLIIFSGATKVYGFIELSIFVLYPQFWKNVWRGLVLLFVVLAMPLVTVGMDGLVSLYSSWLNAIGEHQTRILEYPTVIRAVFAYTGKDLSQYGSMILALPVLLVVWLTLLKKASLSSLKLRYQVLGILMVVMVLWGTGTEYVTYCIVMIGYVLWYLNCDDKTKLDKYLLWTNFIVVSLLPIDLFCPKWISAILLTNLNLNIILFVVTWFRMVYLTYFKGTLSVSETVTTSKF